MTAPPHLAGWVPVHVHRRGPAPELEWAYVGDRRFTAPFFEQTVGEAVRHPFNNLFRRRTPLEVLDAWAEASPGLRPSGLIFHMSRCGSTLIAQMLASLARMVVLSEPTPLDAVLRLPGIDDERRIGWLRGLISALGQRRRGDESHLVIKLDAWNTAALPLIERAFPGVPWVFLVREPVEVLVSQLRQKAAYMVPGLLDFGPVSPEVLHVFASRPEEYCARVLGGICEAALPALRRGDGVPLNYRELPSAVWGRVAALFGLDLTESEQESMRRVTGFNAKSPTEYFQADATAKVAEASDLARSMADAWIRPHYDAIEEIRLARGGA